MEPLDHLEHLDKQLVDELAQVARETVRDELREQTRKQRRTAMLYGASGAVALYAGGALALALGLGIATSLPGWAAALITAAVLGVVAYALRGAARPRHPHPSAPSHGVTAGRSSATPGGMGMPYPPRPTEAPRWPGHDPDGPHHRA
ncbi:phage holin family protein [Streptomyces sp. NPDC086787]|uniref:phage holin family protein n=1 Tax=Streptomyces sp. NPDC086787 TaxID=3365759 RepID=UPI00381687CB